MLSGRSQTPWNSNRSSVLRRGGWGTRRRTTALTASGSSAGWCGGTTAGQQAACGQGPALGQTPLNEDAVAGVGTAANCLGRARCLLVSREPVEEGMLGRVSAGHSGIPEREESLIQGV